MRIYTYFLRRKTDPEPSHGSLVYVGWEEWVLGPCLFDVLDYDKGLGDGFSVVNEHRDLLVHRVVVKKLRALPSEIFLDVLERDTLQFQSPYHSVTEGAY